MVVNLQFVLLSIEAKTKTRNEPSSTYFILKFKNNIGSIFEQEIKCLVTLEDLIKKSYFDKTIIETAKLFKEMDKQKNKEWLAEWVKFTEQVIAVFQNNTKVKVEISY